MLFHCRYDERDVFMSREHFHELSDRLSGSDYLKLPQLFLHGQLLGVRKVKLKHHFRLNVQDSSVIERLNESGELRVLLKPLQVCYTILFQILYFLKTITGSSFC